MHRPAMDPDSHEYSNDDASWGEAPDSTWFEGCQQDTCWCHDLTAVFPGRFCTHCGCDWSARPDDEGGES